MADDPTPSVDEVVNDLPDFDTDLMKIGPSYQLPILKSWMPHLAQIALLWVVFELTRDKFLKKMFAVSGTTPPKGWRGRKGEKRHNLLLQQVDLIFDENSEVRTYLHELVEDAIIIQTKRNVILHGEVSLAIDPVAKLIVQDYRKDGSFEVFEFDGAALKELFYDISLLVGRFSRITPPYMMGPKLSSHDKSILRRLWAKDHQNPPNSPEQ